MKCPMCGLYNQDNAMRCDCGYDFESNTMKESFIPKRVYKPSTAMMAIGWLAAILGGVFGIIISCRIVFGKSADSEDGYKYDAKSRKMGKSMLALSITMIVFWFFIQAAMTT